jgi:7,8-dihydroneopterin aldolase/epimerase/oxygenase
LDRIELRGIVVDARHGADPGERERDQRFEIEVRVELDLSEAVSSDDIIKTLHYGSLYHRIVDTVRERSHALIERVAADVLDLIFEDQRVAGAEVSVAKPGRLGGATPSVTLVRPNPRYRGNSR